MEETPSESVEDIACATFFLRFCREDLAPEAFSYSVPSLEDISKWETEWLVESATPVQKNRTLPQRLLGVAVLFQEELFCGKSLIKALEKRTKRWWKLSP